MMGRKGPSTKPQLREPGRCRQFRPSFEQEGRAHRASKKPGRRRWSDAIRGQCPDPSAINRARSLPWAIDAGPADPADDRRRHPLGGPRNRHRQARPKPPPACPFPRIGPPRMHCRAPPGATDPGSACSAGIAQTTAPGRTGRSGLIVLQKVWRYSASRENQGL